MAAYPPGGCTGVEVGAAATTRSGVGPIVGKAGVLTPVRYPRVRRHSARIAPAAPSTVSNGIGRQHPQPPTETSVPRRVRVR